MSNNIFTPKQAKLMSVFKRNMLKRINILEGSVRSGKTHISLILWAFWVGTRSDKHEFLMCAKSLTTLKRNCLTPLQKLVGKKNFTFSMSKKEAMLFGRQVYLEGANDARSEDKIRGLTLDGAYCDELTLFPQDFFVMLLSRLSIKGAKLIATTNPDNPTHWLNKNYLEKEYELDMFTMKFLLDDNTFLDEDYKNNLKREYTGMYFKRFIQGLWVAAEGAIYQYFSENKSKFVVDDFNPKDIIYATIGVDFGGSGSAHAFVCAGYTAGLKDVVVLEEYYKPGDKMNSPQELEKAFVEFVRYCKSKYKIMEARADSAEQLLIKGLRYAVQNEGIGIHIKNAIKGKTTERIRFFSRLQGAHRFYVNRRCVKVIEALDTAVWNFNEKTMKEERLDNGSTNIDSLDAAEYAVEPLMKQILHVRGENK